LEKLPARRLVAKAVTAPTGKKTKAEVVNLKDFTAGILQIKSSKYRHQYWNAVTRQN
jgi:hypothetical protein